MKKAFTLIEVNLAILVMAGGILSIVGLYSLGFRENRQSTEDVAAAAYADAVLSPMVMALTSTNVTWRKFSTMGNYPDIRGWGAYVDNDGLVTTDPDSTGRRSFGWLEGQIDNTGDLLAEWPDSASGGLRAGVVIMHDPGSAVARIAFRATKIPGQLLSTPIYYAEARFQGEVR